MEEVGGAAGGECLKLNRRASSYTVIMIKIHYFREFRLLLRHPTFKGVFASLSPSPGLQRGPGLQGERCAGEELPLFSERDSGEAAHAEGSSNAISRKGHAGNVRGIPLESLLSAA